MNRMPAYWGLCGSLYTAPTLFIADVLQLETLNDELDLPDMYFYTSPKRQGDGGMPLRAVVVQGSVVGVQPLPGKNNKGCILLLDDTTGVVACVHWGAVALDDDERLQLGALVRCRGRIGDFRQQRQLTVYDLQSMHKYQNAFSAHIMRVLHLKQHVYDRPLSDIVPSGALQAATHLAKRVEEEKKSPIVNGRLYLSRMRDTDWTMSNLKYLIAQLVSPIDEGGDNTMNSFAFDVTSLVHLPVIEQFLVKMDSKDPFRTLRVALLSLEQDGIVINVDERKNEKFHFITHAHHLAPAIMDIVNSVDDDSSVTEDTLFNGVKSSIAYSMVIRKKVQETISKLITQGALYEAGFRAYRSPKL